MNTMLRLAGAAALIFAVILTLEAISIPNTANLTAGGAALLAALLAGVLLGLSGPTT